ncbi:uncharacterized protein PFLUO_LOCUS4096 [Penicillium psychrofluorescens]|uniref:uncharacterized protein n=1 Tax=Penicillium psychrofluorescens TaxID=3158075 RepID=UPI003CCCFF4C
MKRPFESGPRSASTSYMGQDSALSRLGSLFGDRRSEDPLYRDRDRTASHRTDAKASRGASSRFGSLYGDREPAERQSSASTWEQRSHPASPEIRRFPAPESASGFGFGAIQSYTKSLGSQPGGGRQPSSLQSRHSQPTSPPHEPTFKQTQPPRIGSTPAGASSSAVPGPFSLSTTEDTRRKGSDELFHHRNLLAVGADGKRGGRASPLPQAVQGAQAPFIGGPTGESGIKNELGRVFSGIGSGVGGVTASSANSGSPTPMTSSPFKRDSFTGRSSNGEVFDESNIARPASATGSKRARKSQDEDVQMDLEGSTLSARGNRRARHPHQHHHHHHHHHHRHKLEEEAVAGLQRPLSSANYLHPTSTPADGTPASASGHHHHHHHHHHHAPRPAALPVAISTPLREPRTTVNIEPLLSSVADRPRHHLGSTLYTPRISAPSAKASVDSAKFGYTTIPQPLPRFEGRENCTFTVRVPRFRIDANHREEICARRALWGTGVYTDDSDPVAAAIHSGYIRGAWGEDVDESMLDLEIKDTYQHAPQPEVNGVDALKADAQASREPRLPPVPPADKDLHITLLILPRLERYDSAVLFGIKSRVWDGRHDGMSFKVHRIDWVDEGVGRGEERSGEARRKRLRTLMQSGRICTGPAMAKMDALRQSGVQVPRALDGKNQPAPVQPVS